MPSALTRGQARALCKALLREACRTKLSPRHVADEDIEDFADSVTDDRPGLEIAKSLFPFPEHFNFDRNVSETEAALAVVRAGGLLNNRSIPVDVAIRTKCGTGARRLRIEEIRDFVHDEWVRYRTVVNDSKDMPWREKRRLRRNQLSQLASVLEGYVLIFEHELPAEAARMTVSQRLLQL